MQTSTDGILSRSFCADITTPILAYTALKANYPHAVLLESLTDQDYQGRYSHIGFDAIAEITVTGNTVTRTGTAECTVETHRIENQTATVRTGAGIVHESDPQKEADETKMKARSILQAITTARAE